jgi:hypothetical protein
VDVVVDIFIDLEEEVDGGTHLIGLIIVIFLFGMIMHPHGMNTFPIGMIFGP